MVPLETVFNVIQQNMSNNDKIQSREAERLVYLLDQLKRDGKGGMRKIGSMLGVKHSFLSNLKSVTRYSINARLVRAVKDKLGIHPDYFFDDYDGEADYKDYLVKDRISLPVSEMDRINTRQDRFARKLDEMTARLEGMEEAEKRNVAAAAEKKPRKRKRKVT